MLTGFFAHAVVENPDQFQPVFLVIEHGLIQHNQKIAIRQGEGNYACRRRMAATSSGARSVSVWRDPAISSTTMPGIAPRGVGGVAMNDGVMQTVAARGRP